MSRCRALTRLWNLLRTEPRCPCVLLLDTSSSMQGLPIDALNQGLRTFKDELMKDPRLASG